MGQLLINLLDVAWDKLENKMERWRKKSISIINFCIIHTGRKRCKRMRKDRRRHSRCQKESTIIDLRVIRETNNEATKMLKRNIVISGTLEIDLNSNFKPLEV